MFVQITDDQIINATSVRNAKYSSAAGSDKERLTLEIIYPDGKSDTIEVEGGWAGAAWARLLSLR
jgi:hypothetical protein